MFLNQSLKNISKFENKENSWDQLEEKRCERPLVYL
jgi:hypothetical protein